MRASRTHPWVHRVLALALLLPLGCATTADMYLTNDRSITGYIVEADSEQVFVRREIQDGPVGYAAFKETPIPRKQILMVDHPGNMMLLTGLITTAIGIAIITANSGSCGATTMEVPCQLSHVPVIAGASMSLWGLVVWVRSVTSYMPKIQRP
jgi:hypothetical protein